MTIDRLLFSLALVVGFFMLIVKPKGKVRNILLVAFVLFVFGPVFLPSVFFGRWNSIKELQDRTIIKVIIKPYSTSSDFNLSDTTFELSNPKQIADIQKLLKNTTVYNAGHSHTIWLTYLILITNKSDSLSMRISKTTNQGTRIFKDKYTESYNQNELGDYLEKILNYKNAENY